MGKINFLSEDDLEDDNFVSDFSSLLAKGPEFLLAAITDPDVVST